MYQTESEMYRISTFWNLPETSIFNPLHLARNGFSYPGKGDEVVCFACSAHLKGWSTGDNLHERHKRCAPGCQFANGKVTANVPLKSIATNLAGTTTTDNAKLEKDRAPEIGSDQLTKVYRSAFNRANKNGLLSSSDDFCLDRSSPDFERLRSEQDRLRTFYDWPLTAKSDPDALARSGFFYTGTGDRVQCAYCRVFVQNWKPTDIPDDEHIKHSPQCIFVRGRNDGNIPVVKSSVTDDSRRENENVGQNLTQNGVSFAGSYNHLISESQARSVDEQIVADPPKYPEYSEYERRLQSLRRGKVSPGQTAEDLAEAGWFFVGPGDKVNCFQCGGNLKDWEPHDDPWHEHKKWYPQCSYIRTHKKRPRSQIQSQLIPQASASRFYVEPREIKARMDTPTIRAILDMGYSKDLIRMAIENRLKTKGDDFPNAESLMEALFELEESGSHARRLVTPDPETLGIDSDSANNSLTNSQSSISSHQPEFDSLPAPSSHTAAESAFQSMTAVASEKPAASATPVLAPVPELVAEGTSKSKGKKKRNRKKKTAASATGEDDQQAETPVDTVNDQEKTEEELNLEEIPDEEAVKYLEENRQLREARNCKVCMDAEVDTVFLPCGHLVCCSNCAPHLKNCCICRSYIRGTVKTFLS